MRHLALLCLVLLAVPGLAFNLGPQAPAKPACTVTPPPAVRQGGDTIATAVPITGVPYFTTGTTAGFADDYDEVCPYTGSTAPDVVYSLAPGADMDVTIDMFGSAYDTKIYVYDQDLNLVACNDDYHPDYTSKLEYVLLTGGVTYYLVIDGYGTAFGDYSLDITTGDLPCNLDCPAGAQLEGEPPLEDGYEDNHNAGCGQQGGDDPFQDITEPVFCGVTGWYLSADGSQFRDTDWFEVVIGDGGFLDIEMSAEYSTYLFDLAPTDCSNVAVVQNVTVEACDYGTMTITGEPGEVKWIWVGPTVFSDPGWVGNEYDYILWIYDGGVRTEAHSWSAVKGLFD